MNTEAHVDSRRVMRHGPDPLRYRCAVRRKPYRKRTDEQKQAEAVAFRAWLDKPPTERESILIRCHIGGPLPWSPHYRGWFRYRKNAAKRARRVRKARRGWA